MKRHILPLLLLVAFLMLTACSQADDSENTMVAPATPVPSPDNDEAAAEGKVAVSGSASYFTPAQGEGPYYPVSKPDDRDNDLTVLKGAAGTPAGEIIEFSGKVYDASGSPTTGAVIEIWQTDNNGVYLHPNDPGTEQRDRNFQFYGEAVTAADGGYRFRTILPGHYEPRPRHIHVKVKYENQELLTTQFYFADDPELPGEAILNQAGGEGVHLIIDLQEGLDENGEPALVGERDIILDVDLTS